MNELLANVLSDPHVLLSTAFLFLLAWKIELIVKLARASVVLYIAGYILLNYA